MSDKMLQTAIQAAYLSGRILLDNFRCTGEKDIEEKTTHDFVTAIDKLSEKTIIDYVLGRFPEHSVLAEESGIHEGKEYCWIIDPLDGTTNYIHGHPFFCVSIGLARKGQVILGVVYSPSLGYLFTAYRGMGAFLNDRPIKVSAETKLANCLVATAFPFRRRDLLDEYLRCFLAMYHQIGDIRRDGSAALDMCLTAMGVFDGFWEMRLSPWDIAAGSIILEEAGGVITDFDGRDNYLESGNIICANSEIHPQMLKIIKSAGVLT